LLASGQEAVAVGADGDVEGVCERELAGYPDEELQANRPDRRRHREQPGLQPELLDVLGQPQQQHDQAAGGQARDQAATIRHA
jgi:hypothetical protein